VLHLVWRRCNAADKAIIMLGLIAQVLLYLYITIVVGFITKY
jgi:hypothetical protein